MVYKGYIRPLIDYCAATIITAADCPVNKMTRIQNQSLWGITGEMKSTPIIKLEEAMHII